jgi:hypothetical protein
VELDTEAAAARLGVSEQEVRRLGRERLLRSRRIGRTFLFDECSVDERLAQKPVRGRPLTPARAWAALWILADREVDWLDASSRAKVHAWLREQADREPAAFALSVRRRASISQLRALPAHLSRLPHEADVVVGGLAALGERAMLSAGQPYLYCDERTRDRLTVSYGLRSDSETNVVLLTSTFPLGRLHVGDVMPAVVGAVDLLASVDARERTAGAMFVREALADIR